MRGEMKLNEMFDHLCEGLPRLGSDIALYIALIERQFQARYEAS